MRPKNKRSSLFLAGKFGKILLENLVPGGKFTFFSNYGHKLCQVAVVSGFDPREDTKTGTAAAPINIRDCAHI